MTAETAGNDPGVAGASAGAEVRWLGGRFWGVSESIVGSLTPRIGGESELQTVDFICSAHDAQAVDTEPDYEGLPQGASTRTHMLAGAVAGIMEHCLMFPIDCVKVAYLRVWASGLLLLIHILLSHPNLCCVLWTLCLIGSMFVSIAY